VIVYFNFGVVSLSFKSKPTTTFYYLILLNLPPLADPTYDPYRLVYSLINAF